MKKGFTIIELFVVISITFLLAAILFFGQAEHKQRVALNSAVFELIQNVREVQEMAMVIKETECNGTTTSRYGINFEKDNNSSYFLFADCGDREWEKDDNDKLIREVELDRLVKIYHLSPPSDLNIVFRPPDPITYINGDSVDEEETIILSLRSDPGSADNQKSIKINSVGRIDIE